MNWRIPERGLASTRQRSRRHATPRRGGRSRMPTRAWRRSSTDPYTGAGEEMKALRNIAIILTIAAAVYLLPGGGRAANTFESALWAAFGVGIAYLGLRLYREHRVTLYSLGDRYRALFYGAIGLGVFA